MLLADDEDSGLDGNLCAIDLANGEEIVDEPKVDCGECSVIEFMGAGDVSKSGLNTVKLEGYLRGIPIVVLIDSGATHNFVFRRLAKALDLPISLFPGLQIKLGDGHKVFVSQKCKGGANNLGNT